MASTASWMGVQRLIRSHLLEFQSVSGGSDLATLLGATSTGSGSDGKFFFNQAPDKMTGFWAVFRVIDDFKDGADGRLMIRGTAELSLFAHGRRFQSQVEAMGDLIEEAWLQFRYTEVGGHLSATGIANRFLIPYTEPADRELVHLRMLLAFRCTPMFLLKYSAA